MFDTLLIIILFLQVSLLLCLLTLRSSINIKHLCLLFHSLPILWVFLNSDAPLLHFDLPPWLLNLTEISTPPPPAYFDPPSFIRHLRVRGYNSHLII